MCLNRQMARHGLQMIMFSDHSALINGEVKKLGKACVITTGQFSFYNW